MTPLGKRGYPKQQSPTVGVDLVAHYEAVLYPGRDPESLSWPESWACIVAARQHLIDRDLWPHKTASGQCRRGHPWRKGDGTCGECKRLRDHKAREKDRLAKAKQRLEAEKAKRRAA